MPIVDDNRIKGNLAAYLVASWLSRQCLVRPVAEGTDVGIDLFCETVDKLTRQPFLHFWVQVKSGNQIKVKDGKARCNFKAHHVAYWTRQPVPVYAFLVPEEQLEELKCIYVVDFVRKLFKREVPIAGQDSKELESDLVYQTSGDVLNIDSFVDTSVKVDHMLIQITQGVSAPWPQLQSGYLQQHVKGFRAPYTPVVVDQIRRSACATMGDILDLPEILLAQEPDLAVLAKVIQPFVSGIVPGAYREEHYEDYVAMGRYWRHKGEMESGNEFLTRAIDIIRKDKKFQEMNPFWEGTIAEIQSYMEPDEC